MMRFTDALVSIPFLMLALLLIAAAGPQNMGSPLLLVIVVMLLYAPGMARMARAAGIEVVTRDFVALAHTRRVRLVNYPTRSAAEHERDAAGRIRG